MIAKAVLILKHEHNRPNHVKATLWVTKFHVGDLLGISCQSKDLRS
jgi:hypothetical protein